MNGCSQFWGILIHRGENISYLFQGPQISILQQTTRLDFAEYSVCDYQRATPRKTKTGYRSEVICDTWISNSSFLPLKDGQILIPWTCKCYHIWQKRLSRLFKWKIFEMKRYADYLEIPNVITRVLIVGRQELRAGVRRCDERSQWSEWYEEGDMSQGAWAASRSWKSHRAKFLLEVPERASHANVLILMP